MKFPWEKYEEIPAGRRNTLQIFITNRCNLKCEGCFARNVIGEDKTDIEIEEYEKAVNAFLSKGGKQINILGGEPLLHSKLKQLLDINRRKRIKTTIYTNGGFLDRFSPDDLKGTKIRASLYCKTGKLKSADGLPQAGAAYDACFMVSKKTTVNELLESARHLEENCRCPVFFISSIRELDNPEREFFRDTDITMDLLSYKKLVHEFLDRYEGNMEIHVSKRGVFESTKSPAEYRCRFANYFIGGKIIQCPYDIVNMKFQKDYEFEYRSCQHNNSCLMSKIILRRKKCRNPQALHYPSL